MPMLKNNNNALENFEPHKDEKFTLEEENTEEDCRKLVSESSNTRSHTKASLSECTL